MCAGEAQPAVPDGAHDDQLWLGLEHPPLHPTPAGVGGVQARGQWHEVGRARVLCNNRGVEQGIL